jgi:hypothetical protein
VSGLTRCSIDDPPSSSVIAGLTIPQRPVQRAPESVMGTDFVLYVEDNDDLRELVVELVTCALKRRCVGWSATRRRAAHIPSAWLCVHHRRIQ